MPLRPYDKDKAAGWCAVILLLGLAVWVASCTVEPDDAPVPFRHSNKEFFAACKASEYTVRQCYMLRYGVDGPEQYIRWNGSVQ